MSQTPTLFIMCDLAFSGKSTLAKRIATHLNIPIISTDTMFEELKLEHDNQEQWNRLLEISKKRILDSLMSGQSVICDHPNVKQSERDELRVIAEKANVKACVIYMKTSDEEINQRQEKNKETKERHDPKQKHIDAVRKDFEEPTSEENVYTISSDEDIIDLLHNL